MPIQPSPKLEVQDWGFLGYKQAFQRQLTLVDRRIADDRADRLVLVEHPPVVTVGRSGDAEDLCISEAALGLKGIEFCRVDRGGRATYHGRGQLVAYPIIKLVHKDLHLYLQTLLEVVSAVVRTFGLDPVFKKGQPGVWVNGGKIASVGIAVKKWVTYHGVALNVNLDLEPFNWIVPCGHRGETMTSLHSILGKSIDLDEIKKSLSKNFASHSPITCRQMQPGEGLVTRIGSDVRLPPQPPSTGWKTCWIDSIWQRCAKVRNAPTWVNVSSAVRPPS